MGASPNPCVRAYALYLIWLFLFKNCLEIREALFLDSEPEDCKAADSDYQHRADYYCNNRSCTETVLGLSVIGKAALCFVSANVTDLVIILINVRACIYLLTASTELVMTVLIGDPLNAGRMSVCCLKLRAA